MKVLIYITLFTLIFSLYAKLHVCINYIINQKYYAEVLCEKKAEPESCCQGKCAMEKELMNVTEKEENKSQNQTPVLKIAKTEEAICVQLSLNKNQRFVSTIYTPYTKKESVGQTFKLNKPPSV